MERYVEQLLQDLEAARLAAPEPWATLDDDEDDASTGQPRFDAIHLAPTRSLEDWTGIHKITLPPGEKLSDTHLSRLLQSLKELLTAFQCHVVFQQNNVPERVQYLIVRLRFHQRIPLVHANEHFFSFCDPGQDQASCPMGDYCECRYLDNFLDADEGREDVPISFQLPDGTPEFYLRRSHGDEFLPGPKEDDEDFLGESGESDWDGEEED